MLFVVLIYLLIILNFLVITTDCYHESEIDYFAQAESHSIHDTDSFIFKYMNDHPLNNENDWNKLYNEGLRLEFSGKLYDAINHYIHSFELSKIENLSAERISFCYNQLKENYNTKLWFEKAIEMYQNLLHQKMSMSTKDIPKISQLLLKVGILNHEYGYFDESLRIYNYGIELISNNKPLNYQYELELFYFHVGLAYQHQGNMLQAFNNFKNCLNINTYNIKSRINIGAILQQFSYAIDNYNIVLDNLIITFYELSDIWLPDINYYNEFLMASTNIITAHYQAEQYIEVCFIFIINFFQSIFIVCFLGFK